MSMHDRIREARKRLGVTQGELGEAIGVAKTTIAGYEKNREPTAAQLGAIADFLRVDVNFLLQDEMRERIEYNATPREMEQLVKKYRALDGHGKEMVDIVLEKEHTRIAEATRAPAAEPEKIIYFSLPYYQHPMSAGYGELAELEEPETLLLIKQPPRGTTYAAPVKGNSMEPTYHDGDIVFVKQQEEVYPGQVGVFLMDGDQYIKELGNGVLISHNSEYEPRTMTNDIRCQGRVLGVCGPEYFE